LILAPFLCDPITAMLIWFHLQVCIVLSEFSITFMRRYCALAHESYAHSIHLFNV
jgi:hypothetical protein